MATGHFWAVNGAAEPPPTQSVSMGVSTDIQSYPRQLAMLQAAGLDRPSQGPANNAMALPLGPRLPAEVINMILRLVPCLDFGTRFSLRFRRADLTTIRQHRVNFGPPEVYNDRLPAEIARHLKIWMLIDRNWFQECVPYIWRSLRFEPTRNPPSRILGAISNLRGASVWRQTWYFVAVASLYFGPLRLNNTEPEGFHPDFSYWFDVYLGLIPSFRNLEHVEIRGHLPRGNQLLDSIRRSARRAAFYTGTDTRDRHGDRPATVIIQGLLVDPATVIKFLQTALWANIERLELLDGALSTRDIPLAVIQEIRRDVRKLVLRQPVGITAAGFSQYLRETATKHPYLQHLEWSLPDAPTGGFDRTLSGPPTISHIKMLKLIDTITNGRGSGSRVRAAYFEAINLPDSLESLCLVGMRCVAESTDAFLNLIARHPNLKKLSLINCAISVGLICLYVSRFLPSGKLTPVAFCQAETIDAFAPILNDTNLTSFIIVNPWMISQDGIFSILEALPPTIEHLVVDEPRYMTLLDFAKGIEDLPNLTTARVRHRRRRPDGTDGTEVFLARSMLAVDHPGLRVLDAPYFWAECLAQWMPNLRLADIDYLS